VSIEYDRMMALMPRKAIYLFDVRFCIAASFGRFEASEPPPPPKIARRSAAIKRCMRNKRKSMISFEV
jgi:hypothetical protein